MENEIKGGLNTDFDASKIPDQCYSIKEAGSICVDLPNTGQNIVISEEHKLSWLSIGDLKALLDYARQQQSYLTPQSSIEYHDYWHNIICKVDEELMKQVTDIFKLPS